MTWEDEASKDICGKRAREEAWKAFQKSWAETYVSITVPEPPIETKIPNSVEHFGNLDDPATKSTIMMKYDSHRKVISDAALVSEYDL
jgi:hypothetical protein